MIMTEMYIPVIYYHIMPAPAIHCHYHHSISTMCTTTTAMFIYVCMVHTTVSKSDNIVLNKITEIQDFWHVTLCSLVVTDIFERHSFSIVKVRYSEMSSAIISKSETEKDKEGSGNALI